MSLLIAQKYVEYLLLDLNPTLFLQLFGPDFYVNSSKTDVTFEGAFEEYQQKILRCHFENVAWVKINYIYYKVKEDCVKVKIDCDQYRRGYGVNEDGPGKYHLTSTCYIYTEDNKIKKIDQPVYNKVKV